MNPSSACHMKDLVIKFSEIIKPDLYLELGVENAYTISQVASHSKRSIGVDIKRAFGSCNFEFYEISTDEFFKRVTEKKIPLDGLDMVFIDADHSYDQSRKDFMNVFPYVREQGLIFLHDTFPTCKEHVVPSYTGDTYRLARELSFVDKFDNTLEIVTIPCFPGLSIIRKRSKHLLWE